MTEPLTYRILREHLVAGELVHGHDIMVTVDQVLLEDAAATMVAMQFEMLDGDEVAVPLCIIYTDHNVLQIDDKNMQDHTATSGRSRTGTARASGRRATASPTTCTSSVSRGRVRCLLVCPKVVGVGATDRASALTR